MEMDTASERSFFFALLAAPTAIAAEVPQTDVAVATVMTKGLLSIFSTLVPNHHINRMTMGVTIQAMPRPYNPKFTILENSTENPMITRPALI